MAFKKWIASTCVWLLLSSMNNAEEIETVALRSRPTHKELPRSLQTEIERVIRTVDPDVHIGIEVISLKDNQKVYQKNENHLFVPASNLKVLTAAAALHYLGVDFRFETKLLTDGSKKKHHIKGNVYLKGSGDPELSIRALEDLVFQLKLQGVQRIEGNLYVDISEFDEISQGPGWMWDEGAAFYNSPVGPLTVNHGCIDIWVKPGAKSGEEPTVYARPRTGYVGLRNTATTSVDENTIKVDRRWMTKENLLEVEGKIPVNAEPLYVNIPVEAPHLFTAFVLRDILFKNEIGVSGEIEIKTAPEMAKPLASTFSRPLSQIVETMMKESDNLLADNLFKKIGQMRYGTPGTWQKGTKAVRDFLTNQIGLNCDRVVIMDGSGLSRYNLISPHHLAESMQWMKKQFACASEFCSSLPISGMDGTLTTRMTDPFIKGKVRAKTGAMTGVSSLSGYATTKEEDELVFSIMVNGFTKSAKDYKVQLEDKICELLVNYAGE